MRLSKQFWRSWAAVTLAVVSSAALGVAHASERKPAASTGNGSKAGAVLKAGVKPTSTTKRTQPTQAAALQSTRFKTTAKVAAAVATPLATVTAAKAAPQPLINSDAEERLLKVIALVQQQQLNAAIKAAASLTADIPHFQAAQLVYADLLRYRSGKGPLPTLPVAAADKVILTQYTPVQIDASAKSETLEQLHGLQEEIKRRVKGATVLPPAGSVPQEFLALAANVPKAIAIDASQSRLYLFNNEGGQLRLMGDYYVTVGKLGMGKLEEGDQRTPQGIYFVGRHIPGVKLPDFYGKGALTVNYPNDWDRVQGRTGSGIWLHGTPPDKFARLPQASDGCMVLSNADLLHLIRSVDRLTPVLVRDNLQWRPQASTAQTQERDAFLAVLGQWSQSWNQATATTQALPVTQTPVTHITPATAQMYAPDLLESPEGKNLQTRLSAAFKSGDAVLQDVSVYGWRDPRGEIRVANFRLKSRNLAEPMSLRQYWRKQGSSWKLFSEDTQS